MWVKLLLLFFVFSFLFRTDFSFDQDLGRHLKLGEIILQTKVVPKINLFSYTNPDFPFINTHWLFEVFVYLTGQALGLQSLLIIKILIFLLSVYLILKIIPKENLAFLLPIGFVFLHVLRERLELRPEIFSFLFTAGTYFILEKYQKKPTKLIFLLPLIQLIWINTHIYFFIGLTLQAIFLVALGYRYLRSKSGIGKLKLLTILFALSIIVSLINPNGLAGLLYPLNVTKNYGYTIAENQTMFLLESINFRDPNFLFVKLGIAIAFFSLLVGLLRKKLELKNILLTVSGITLALMNVRSFPYLVFLSLPAVFQNFEGIKFNAFAKILTIIFGTLLIMESYFYLNGDYYRYKDDSNTVALRLAESGKAAMDFTLKNNLPGPIYNNFDIGSYIIYRGYPRFKVFIDGRPEAYPKEFFSDVYVPTQADYSKFNKLEERYGFKTILFSITDQTPWGKSFLASVVKDTSWRTVYIDDFIIVLVKDNIADEKKLSVINLSQLNPSAFRFSNHRSYLNLSFFLLNIGYQNAALSFSKSALSLFPDSPAGNAVLESVTGTISGSIQTKRFFW